MNEMMSEPHAGELILSKKGKKINELVNTSSTNDFVSRTKIEPFPCPYRNRCNLTTIVVS